MYFILFILIGIILYYSLNRQPSSNTIKEETKIEIEIQSERNIPRVTYSPTEILTDNSLSLTDQIFNRIQQRFVIEEDPSFEFIKKDILQLHLDIRNTDVNDISYSTDQLASSLTNNNNINEILLKYNIVLYDDLLMYYFVFGGFEKLKELSEYEKLLLEYRMFTKGHTFFGKQYLYCFDNPIKVNPSINLKHIILTDLYPLKLLKSIDVLKVKTLKDLRKKYQKQLDFSKTKGISSDSSKMLLNILVRYKYHDDPVHKYINNDTISYDYKIKYDLPYNINPHFVIKDLRKKFKTQPSNIVKMFDLENPPSEILNLINHDDFSYNYSPRTRPKMLYPIDIYNSFNNTPSLKQIKLFQGEAILKESSSQRMKDLHKSRKCKICNKEFKPINIIPIPPKHNICGGCPILEKPTKEKIREYGLELLSMFNETPTRSINISSKELADNFTENEWIDFLKLYAKIGGIEHINNEFGGWTSFLLDSGLVDEIKSGFGVICKAKDGTICNSLSEKKITNWLIDNNIKYKKEPLYPEDEKLNYTEMRADWKIGNRYIEFFGLAGNSVYDEKIKTKRKLSEKYNLQLIELYHKDLNNLDEKLSPLKA